MLGTLIRKLNYSLNGLRDTWVSETSFRQWCFVVVVSDGLALYLFSGSFVTGVIVLAGFVLLAAELSNTAIEAVVDRVESQWKRAGRKGEGCRKRHGLSDLSRAPCRLGIRVA